MTAVADGPSPVLAADTQADVIEQLMSEFEDRLELSTISDVVLGCRADLDCSPVAALPELIERLARQRLLDRAAGGPDRPVAAGGS